MDRNEFNKNVSYRPIRETKHLYHGSKNGIRGNIVPDFKLARAKVDFGQGFYLGDNITQAKTLICGRDDYHPVLYKADIDLTGLHCVQVKELPWALLIAYNRRLLEDYKGTALYEQIAGIGDGQDVIIGPIADDRTSVVLEDFFEGTITDAALVACMGQLNLGTQYVVKTQRACDRISITDTYPLTQAEIQSLRAEGIQRREEGVRLVDPVKRRYRGTGEYFDEILEKGSDQFAIDYPTTPPV